MIQEIVKRECDIIGIHLVYSWEYTSQILSSINKIKSHTEAPIVVYGFYPTFAYEFILKNCPAIDYVIMGEPELTFLELSRLWKKCKDVDKAYGIALRDGKEIAANKRREIIEDLDMLPFPIRTREQLEYTGGNILGSRGCYGNCTFCYINNFYGKKCHWRGRTAHNIYREVHTVLENLKEKYIYFIDANFFGPGASGQKRAEEIATLLQGERGLRFGLECRVNDVQEKSLSALSRAGLHNVFLGVESGSKRSLKRMKKGTTITQAEKAIALLRSYSIEPYCGFIMFEPDASLQDIRDNFNFLQKNCLINRLITTVDLLYHPQIILMGTESYTLLEERDNLELCFHSPYQGTFFFNDDRVQFLAEVISPVAQYLLTLMDTSDSPLYWRNEYSDGKCSSQKISNELNLWLGEFFGELLTKLERHELDYRNNSETQYINDSINVINSIIAKGEREVGAALC
jgi:radical SAM superfamily enzyme YgiQ (UPF0313 family)